MKFGRFICLLFLLTAWFSPSPASGANALAQEVYVWQRNWNGPVHEALMEHAGAFQALVVLKAEINWHKKVPQIIRVPLDFNLLKQTGKPVGLALRIGPYPGPFATNDATATLLCDLAAALVNEAKASGLNPAELQIDFDCASAKLAGYRTWVTAIRSKIAPAPLTITVLPDWLNQPAFGSLVNAAGSYVLQVHSLAAPKNRDALFTLCDPVAAKKAVEQAASFGVPFRVALPTYGYLLAFDQAGKFVSLAAEGSSPNWPADVQTRAVRTDPVAMADLVRTWTAQHPATMQGIIWYRLPVGNEALNLSWPTLAAMMAGKPPHPHARAEARRSEPGLWEITFINDGELDLTPPLMVEGHWEKARFVAGDGAGGFELSSDKPETAHFQINRSGYRLPAGEKQIIGWLRLSEDREVHVEISKN